MMQITADANECRNFAARQEGWQLRKEGGQMHIQLPDCTPDWSAVVANGEKTCE